MQPLPGRDTILKSLNEFEIDVYEIMKLQNMKLHKQQNEFQACENLVNNIMCVRYLQHRIVTLTPSQADCLEL